jgi:biopolymer transport protein ExbD
MSMSPSSQNHDSDQEEIVSEINMTPLIDVMLVLLIIFMVTSSVALESGMDVVLPQVTQTSETKAPDPLVISVGKEGDIAIQGKKVDPKDPNLKELIKKQLETLKTETVVLEGDTLSRLGVAVELMDMARNAGAKQFSIAAEKTDKK